MERNREGQLGHLGHYELLNRIGAGGMGSVYRARDTRTGAHLALKLMHNAAFADPAALERFRREAQVSALLDSLHIVRMVDFGSEGGQHYIVSELVEGRSVADLLREGPVEPGSAAAIAAHVAAALEEASRHGVVHRDIKPGNILVSSAGVAKVTDFGIAVVEHASSLTVPGLFVGTAAYAAPEQHRGQADLRSDIYSLGVVLFEMLTGRLPYQADTVTAMMRLHEEAPIPVWELGGVSPLLAGVVERCLQKQPARRFQSPAQLRAALGIEPPRPPAAGGAGADLPPALAGFAPAADTVVAPQPVAAFAGPATTGTVHAAPFAAGATVVGTPEGAPVAVAGRGGHEPLAHLRGASMLRGAAIAGAAITALTVAALFGFRGSEAEQPPLDGGGGGGGGGWHSSSDETPAPALPTVTATPFPPTVTPTATPTFAPTVTPTPEPPTPTPVPPTPTPIPPTAPPKPPTATATATTPPAPAHTVVNAVFCHLTGCPYGGQDLDVGLPIGVGFQLSAPTPLPVAAEVWFRGRREYTSNFTASATGMYFDLLPAAATPGNLELRIFVGGRYIGSIHATVS